jgi:hypothetical protein
MALEETGPGGLAKDLAASIAKEWPDTLRMATLAGGPFLQPFASEGTSLQERDIVTHKWLLRACFAVYPSAVPGIDTVNTALLALNATYGGQVFPKGFRDTLLLAGEIQRLIQATRKLWRRSKQARSPHLAELKDLLQARNSPPPAGSASSSTGRGGLTRHLGAVASA